MTPYLIDWLALIVRWFHVIAGIAWIGASFYFVWLDLNLRKPPEWKAERGIKGDLWAIHGGGIYEVAKYHSRPEVMPEHLHWFKWEAYTTWLTGTALLVLVYYVHAATYLIDGGSVIQDPVLAVLASLAFIAAGPAVYEAALRTRLRENGGAFALLVATLFVVASWLAMQLFSPRAAFVHVGMLIGTIMVGNVFFGIIPSQKAFIKAVDAGAEPDLTRMDLARLRSTHNNYLTLPVVFCMISNHFPQVYGHAWSWLLLAGLAGAGAYARHFFMLRHRGIVRPQILVAAAVAALALGVVTAPAPVSVTPDANAAAAPSGDLAHVGLAIVETHCTGCHAEHPTFAGLTAAPQGIVLADAADVARHAAKIHAVAVAGQAMPLGNLTAMRTEERVLLGAWLEQLSAARP